MLTDDKVKSGADVYDNVNTRDQNRTLIILLVIGAFFLFGLIGLGLSHAPEVKTQETVNTAAAGGQPPQAAGAEAGFSVNKITGEVELPGTIGKPQHFLIGHGNQPATEQGAAATNSAETAGTSGTAQPGTPQSGTAQQAPAQSGNSATH